MAYSPTYDPQSEADPEDNPKYLDGYEVKQLGTDAQKAAYAELEVHLTAAREALAKAEKLAEEHGLSFHFGINTYNDPYDDYGDGGWRHSAVC
jgi:hypothetical protein